MMLILRGHFSGKLHITWVSSFSQKGAIIRSNVARRVEDKIAGSLSRFSRNICDEVCKL